MRMPVLAAALCAAGLTLSACGVTGGSGYQVRAIFDSAANVIPGEDVKIAGVKVGSVGALDVTADQKAAVTLDITSAGFQDFRTDAGCTIRPQSLIGEKFVECVPTQAHPIGAPLPPPLSVVPSGQKGAGQHYLPVTNTSSPVDLDIVGDVLRLPYRQRLTIIINELGAGLGGRGSDLRDVIRRADPALAQTDRVLAIVAAQNRTLAQLAHDSNIAIAPLAAERARVADWIVQANTVALATAEKRGALQQSLIDLPPFLRQLTPTLASLSQFSAAATPVLNNLAAASPSLNVASTHLVPLFHVATPYVVSLGQTAQKGTPAVVASAPTAALLASLATQLKPFAADTASLFTNIQATGGLERILDFVFLGASSLNGYTSLGHYLRSVLVVNPCSTYATTPTAGCNGNFVNTGLSAASTASTTGLGDPTLQRTAAVLRGATPAHALSEFPPSGSGVIAPAQRAPASTAPTHAAPAGGSPSAGQSAPQLAQPNGAGTAQPSGSPVARAPTAGAASSPRTPSRATTSALLGYLLGG